MSDTTKCPKCGGDLFWCENGYPRFAYCTNTEECGYETPSSSDKEAGEIMASAALHRIRELEARIAAKDEALKQLADDQFGYGMDDVAREALKK